MESSKPFGNIAERNGRIDGQMKSKAQLQQGFCRVSIVVVFQLAELAEMVTLLQ